MCLLEWSGVYIFKPTNISINKNVVLRQERKEGGGGKTAQAFEKSLLKATPPKTENPSWGVGRIKHSKHHVYTPVWFLKCCFSCPGKEKRGATLRLSSQFQKRSPVITKNSFSLSYPSMLGAGRRGAFQLCDKTIKLWQITPSSPNSFLSGATYKGQVLIHSRHLNPLCLSL